MTTEEAIAYWEVFQREIDLLYPLCDERSKATLGEQREPVALALSALRAQQKAEANSPLTLDDLRRMDGEPVWVVVLDFSAEWRILECVDTRSKDKAVLFRDGSHEPLTEYGKEWLAYRHKPKEA